MISVEKIVQWMSELAPLHLSEAWDNTGLLLGDPSRAVERVMTCLTLSEDCVGEAVDREADLVVSHHPLPFHPLAKITTTEETGRRVWELASHAISVYSPHTAWDSAEHGINAQLAAAVGAVDSRPLIPRPEPELAMVGTGRLASLAPAISFQELVRLLKSRIPAARLRGVTTDRPIASVALACGSGGSLVEHAVQAGADVLVTGEATYHACLEAKASGMGVLMLGHFASERFAMERLASRLQAAFPTTVVWAAQCESDPVRDLQP